MFPSAFPYSSPISKPFMPTGYSGANIDVGSTLTYTAFRLPNVLGWLNQGGVVGVGYARKAHPGVYLQVDWPPFNRWVATQIKAGEMGAKKGILDVGRTLHNKIQQRNPVKTGLSRAAWELRTTGLANRLKPSVVIANQVHYVVKLEFGSSRQAPHGMVRISMKEMMGIPPVEILKQIKLERKRYRAFAARIPAGVSRTFNLPFGGNL